MISRKTTLALLGASTALGIVTLPLLASTPDVKLQDLDTVADLKQLEPSYPRYAQVGGDEMGGSGGADEDRRNARTGPAVTVSEPQTRLIVSQLNQIQQICEFMGDEYRIACFATTYRELAQDIPANGDYAETREVLLDTARKLDSIVRSNIDRSKPALTARLRNPSGQAVATPPMRAVQEPRAAQLNQQAANIVEEAETVLLRSASSDATRAIHFQRIAAAVGSNKVLLRSS